MGFAGDKNEGIVDLNVYTDRHDLRLPGCVKIKGSRIENRKFQIV